MATEPSLRDLADRPVGDHAVMHRVLVTGAAGRIGRRLRPRLARTDRILRLLDLAEIEPRAASERVEVVRGSVTDMATMETACRDVDAVVHLAGYSKETAWGDVMAVNIGGTYTVFEAARRNGVSRVIFASSTHAAGFTPVRPGTEVPDFQYPRPDTNYGVAKVAGEAIGSLYADRYGMDVICIRIGVAFGGPGAPSMLGRWLSPDDCGRLFDACLLAPAPGFRVVWGVSANTRVQLSLAEALRLGYEPLDNSEEQASQAAAEYGEADPADPALHYLGGDWLGPEFDTARLDYESTRKPGRPTQD